MFGASVNFKPVNAKVAYFIMRQHAFDGEAHRFFGVVAHHVFVAFGFEAAYIAGMGIVDFILQFVSGQHGFFGVDYNNEFTAIHMRGEFRAVFAS